MTSEVGLGDAEVVEQVRDRRRVRAEHLATHLDGLSLHRLRLGVLTKRAEQVREVIQDRDRTRVPTRLGAGKYGERFLIRVLRALILLAPHMVAAERSQDLR